MNIDASYNSKAHRNMERNPDNASFLCLIGPDQDITKNEATITSDPRIKEEASEKTTTCWEKITRLYRRKSIDKMRPYLDFYMSEKDCIKISVQQDSGFKASIEIPNDFVQVYSRITETSSYNVFKCGKKTIYHPVSTEPFIRTISSTVQTEEPVGLSTCDVQIEMQSENRHGNEITGIINEAQVDIHSDQRSDIDTEILETGNTHDAYEETKSVQNYYADHSSYNREEKLPSNDMFKEMRRKVRINGLPYHQTKFSYKTLNQCSATFSMFLFIVESFEALFSFQAILHHFKLEKKSRESLFKALKISRIGNIDTVTLFEPRSDNYYSAIDFLMPFQNSNFECIPDDNDNLSMTEFNVQDEEISTATAKVKISDNVENTNGYNHLLKTFETNNLETKSTIEQESFEHIIEAKDQSKVSEKENPTLDIEDKEFFTQAQSAQDYGDHKPVMTKMKNAKVKHRTQPDSLKYIFITRDEEILIALLNDITRTQIIHEGVHGFFNNVLKLQFSRPSVPIPSMHPLLPYQIRYLDKSNKDENGEPRWASSVSSNPTSDKEHKKSDSDSEEHVKRLDKKETHE